MGLCDNVVRATRSSGYETPTEIQLKAIPAALAGRDVLGCAPTGTGKTAAFVLPILTNLGRSPAEGLVRGCPRALILTPTRELAQQILEATRTYGAYTGIRAMAIYGGMSMERQIHDLQRGADIVIATPGRLLDHISRASIRLSRVNILVLDEADRMYDMGFIRDVRKIIALIPEKRQTMLFSATMSSEIRALVAGIQKQPHRVDVGQTFSPVESVEQKFFAVPRHLKLGLLVHILRGQQAESLLVFSRTKHGADHIAEYLGRCGFPAAVIHSNRSQGQRQRALDGFKRREVRILVATDIAARGIDIDKISHVINYDTPVFAEDYIHRIGRTGRAEHKGQAFTFVSADEMSALRRIESHTRRVCTPQNYPGFDHGPETLKQPAQPLPKRSLYRRQSGGHSMRRPRYV
jgi:ATP-dependent RNA helicase RhlE